MAKTLAHHDTKLGPTEHQGFWMDTESHRAWLKSDAIRQFKFFETGFRPEGGFYQLNTDGTPATDAPQELFATTRMVHSYAIGAVAGFSDCEKMIDHGMAFINQFHRDPIHGGYVWSLQDNQIADDRKLAYGHAFVLLAAASALQAGHPDAPRLLQDATDVLLERLWDDERGVFADEANRDWSPFSTYRGFNANMHATEALLAAYEATNDQRYLDMASRILGFFAHQIAPENGYRLPEHYTKDWKVDRTYVGDPMFRPVGSTPGHSFELARLLIQHWDLSGRPDSGAFELARKLVDTALKDGWDTVNGGLIYTLDYDGALDVTNRYWWPVTEAIGVLSSLIKVTQNADDEVWYRRMWQFADTHFIDHERGGWFPEIDSAGNPTSKQFQGKPDLYHSIQATLLPLSDRISKTYGNLI